MIESCNRRTETAIESIVLKLTVIIRFTINNSKITHANAYKWQYHTI